MGGIGEYKIGQAEAQKSEYRAITERNIRTLFERGIIKTKKEYEELLMAYLAGEVSFGQNGLTNTELKNFDTVTLTKIQKQYRNYKNTHKKNNKTTYIVQKGDTPYTIAQNMIKEGTPNRENLIKKTALEIETNAKKLDCGTVTAV